MLDFTYLNIGDRLATQIGHIARVEQVILDLRYSFGKPRPKYDDFVRIVQDSRVRICDIRALGEDKPRVSLSVPGTSMSLGRAPIWTNGSGGT